MDQVTDSKDQETIIHCAKNFYKLYGDIFRSINTTNIEEIIFD
jgi:hypothetical protein